jgi:hypothetical protein
MFSCMAVIVASFHRRVPSSVRTSLLDTYMYLEY